MGYYIDVMDTNFRIPADKVNDAYEAMKSIQQVGSWVDANFASCKDLSSIVNAWRWEVELDADSGDVVDINFCRSKLGDEDLLFSTLAPFVDGGSYIDVQGEEGERWRWFFDGTRMREVNCHAVYDDETYVSNDVLDAINELLRAENDEFVDKEQAGDWNNKYTVVPKDAIEKLRALINPAK